MIHIEKLNMYFGGIHAIENFSLKVNNGEIMGLIGPNGSGKTTLLNVITGIYQPQSGQISVQNNNITGLAPDQIAKFGIARTFQNIRLYPHMSVFDNVWVGQHVSKGVSWSDWFLPNVSKEKQCRQRVLHFLELTGLISRRDDLAESLSLVEQRRLELARALAHEPSFILIDEPTGGMSANETEDMLDLIDLTVRSKMTCIVIEHNMEVITHLCDQVCVVNFGKKVAEGSPDEVFRDPFVQEIYLGREE